MCVFQERLLLISNPRNIASLTVRICLSSYFICMSEIHVVLLVNWINRVLSRFRDLFKDVRYEYFPSATELGQNYDAMFTFQSMRTPPFVNTWETFITLWRSATDTTNNGKWSFSRETIDERLVYKDRSEIAPDLRNCTGFTRFCFCRWRRLIWKTGLSRRLPGKYCVSFR